MIYTYFYINVIIYSNIDLNYIENGKRQRIFYRSCYPLCIRSLSGLCHINTQLDKHFPLGEKIGKFQDKRNIFKMFREKRLLATFLVGPLRNSTILCLSICSLTMIGCSIINKTTIYRKSLNGSTKKGVVALSAVGKKQNRLIVILEFYYIRIFKGGGGIISGHLIHS